MPIKDPVKRAEYSKKYRETRREEAKERTKKWRAENLEYAQERDREYYKEHREARIATIRKYEKTDAGRAMKRKAWKKSYQKHHAKYLCRDRFKKAISRGFIIRKPCEICGKENAEGHHEDYTKPYEVLWLCPQHHKEWEGKTVMRPRDNN